MPKAPKSIYVCAECGYETSRWLGKCPSCAQWNTLEEQEPQAPVAAASSLSRAAARPQILPAASPAPTLFQVPESGDARITCGINELDRVLGGGAVVGSLVLVGGDPGIGKSTLLLQAADCYARQGARVLYVSGEESTRQIKMRASRLGVEGERLHVLSETNIDTIEGQVKALTPDFMVVDSIQTMYAPGKPSAPGSVSQVREVTSALMRMAKQENVTTYLVGHVTKDGALAGPRVLEHMVDAVLYFEGERHQEYRILRAAKNRFGSVNEIGVFRMMQNGMEEVENPSEFLLAGRLPGAAGAAVAVSMEGTRPVLVDIQALVAQTAFPTPRRQSYGFDHNRMALILAVLEKRAGMALYNQDAYVNVAGGLQLDEPAVDLPVAAAIVSSIKNVAIDEKWAMFGEIGLSGEVRAVNQAERRLMECARMGFTHAVIPQGNKKQLKNVEGLTVYGVSSLAQALALLM